MHATISDLEVLDRLHIAQHHAKLNSGCTKVSVGCVVYKKDKLTALGANRTIPNLCRRKGCLRIAKYGNNSRDHRNPSDCRAIHSEIDAICKSGVQLRGATMYITRYPCEACARAIVAAGIKYVVYGRQQAISEETEWIFMHGSVEVEHVTAFEEDDIVG